MSTHPTPAHRIEKIKELIPKVMPYYEATKKQSTQKIKKEK
jgi:predicted Zn-dependent protease